MISEQIMRMAWQATPLSSRLTTQRPHGLWDVDYGTTFEPFPLVGEAEQPVFPLTVPLSAVYETVVTVGRVVHSQNPQ